ncbi:hypothetical protein J3F84DRAFT_398069 [Trichoderma pleuroticola]
MSRVPRRGHPTRIRITSPLLNNGANNGFEEAKEAFCSLEIFKCEPQHLDGLWQQLRRSYEAENTHNGQPFPIWALKNLPLEQIKAMIRAAYFEDLGAIRTYASKMPPYLDTEPWKFVLFFNYIGQSRARILRKIAMKRPTITFEQLYEEVRRNRRNRLSARKVSNRRPKNPRAHFHISDYKGCLQGSNDEDGIDEEIEDESEVEVETGDEDNENIDQEPYFQLIHENISMGHQEGDNIDGYGVESSHDRGGHLTDNLDGISTRDEEYMIVRHDVDDTSTSSPQANLPTPGTNSPIAIPDDSKPGTSGIEPSTETDGHTLMNPPQQETRRQDTNQRPPSSPDLYSIVRTFASTGKDDIDKQKQKVQDSAKQFIYEKQQLDKKLERLRNAESILAGLAKLDKEDATSKNNIIGFISEDAKAHAEWNNSWPGLMSDKSISVEERISRAKSFILDAEKRSTKRQAEESEIAENKKKRAKLAAEFKKLEATSANREPSLPIRSLESS